MNVRHLSSPPIASSVAPKLTKTRLGTLRVCHRASLRGGNVVTHTVPGAAANSLSTLGRAFGDRAQDGEGQTHILSETTEGNDNTPPRARRTSNLRKAGCRRGADTCWQGLRGGTGPAPRRHLSALSLAWTPGSGRAPTALREKGFDPHLNSSKSHWFFIKHAPYGESHTGAKGCIKPSASYWKHPTLPVTTIRTVTT